MSIATTRHTVEEYFERELASDERHEYLDGEIIPMVGASTAHNEILENLYRLLFVTFLPDMYRVCSDNARLKVIEPVSYMFPDAMLVKKPAEYENSSLDTLLNPVAVFEILSPSTERYNRRQKSQLFRQISSLTDYVLISQDEPLVDHVSRGTGDQWNFQQVRGKDAELIIVHLDWTLKLSDLYRNVSFK